MFLLGIDLDEHKPVHITITKQNRYNDFQVATW